MYEDEYMYFYIGFLWLQSQWLKNHNSSIDHKTILMTVPIGVLVLDDDYFDGIYTQVRMRPRVFVSVYVCMRLYDPRVHMYDFLHCYLHRKF